MAWVSLASVSSVMSRVWLMLSRRSAWPGGDVAQQALLELGGAFQGDVFHSAGIDGEQDYHFLVQRQRGVLRLLQHFGRQLPPGQLGAGGGVQVGGAELGESRQLAVLRQVQPQPPRPPGGMARVCAAPPTRDTDSPTFTADGCRR